MLKATGHYGDITQNIYKPNNNAATLIRQNIQKKGDIGSNMPKIKDWKQIIKFPTQKLAIEQKSKTK